jgi:hypothetical protein
MIICAAGDIHGAIDLLYKDVLLFEAALGVRFEWVLQVGDFGVWPDPSRIDKATKKHDGAGDFPVWFAGRWPAPRKTLFIKGNHEDFVWLDAQPDSEVLPGLFYLRNGRTIDLGEAGRAVRIGGVGGCFAASDFEQPSKLLPRLCKAPLHTRRDRNTLQGFCGRHPSRTRCSSRREVRASSGE